MNEYQITEYNEPAAAIAMLRNKYNTVFDVSTPKGLTAAREARAEIRSYRVSLEKLRVEIKAPALERTRLIDAEAKRITAELLAIEEPIDAVIKAEETRKAEERAAKERAEQARIAEIQNRITAMRGAVTAAFNKPPSFTAELMAKVRAVPVTAVEFSEFLAIAETAKAETLESLAGLLAEQQAHEAEQARIVAEREELARLRAQDEQRQAEQRRIEAEERAKVEAAAVEVRKAQAEEQARIAAAQVELDRRQRAIEEAEAKARAEAEAKQRAEEEAKAKVQAEALAQLEATKAAKANPRDKAKTDPLEGIKQALAAVEFSEFLAIAETAKTETLESLAGLLAEQQAHEAEQARIAAEREELARLRAQDEERQAEQRRIEAEERVKVEAAAAEVRKAQEEEQARIATAQAELDKRQRAIEEAEAKARAEIEAKQRAEEEAKAKAAKANPRDKAKTDTLEGIKQALADGTVSPLEAVVQAYQLGYSAGYSAGMDDYL